MTDFPEGHKDIGDVVPPHIEELRHLRPGVGAIARLVEVDPRSVSLEARVVLLDVWQRQHAWVTAKVQDLALALTGDVPPPRESDHEPSGDAADGATAEESRDAIPAVGDGGAATDGVAALDAA